MMETIFQSEELPVEDRFDGWREWNSHIPVPVAVSSPHAPDYRATVRKLRLGEITVPQGAYQPATLRRTPKLIRVSDPETYGLTLVVRGSARMSHSHGEFTYRRYDMVVRSSSRPHTIWTDGSPGGFATLAVDIPAALLPLPRDRADQIIGRPLSGRTGIGALLAGFLTRLARESGTCRAADGPRLGAVAADLVCSLVAHTLDTDRAVPAETHQRVLTMRVRAFIEQHLRDPGLNPATIAAAHNVSLSHLHQLFDLDGLSVMAWIRRQRLERARRDLTDAELRTMPVHAIARRWGFSQHSVFTRAFRAAYGMSPSDQRHEAGHDAGRNGTVTGRGGGGRSGPRSRPA